LQYNACFVLRFQEKISNVIENQSTWFVVDITTCRNNLHNDNEMFYSQDASWSYRLWFGLDNVFAIRCILPTYNNTIQFLSRNLQNNNVSFIEEDSFKDLFTLFKMWVVLLKPTFLIICDSLACVKPDYFSVKSVCETAQ
jgi:hypothetical protein